MVKILKKIFKVLVSRSFIFSFLILLQLSFVIFITWRLTYGRVYVHYFFTGLSIVVAVMILNRTFNPAYKISWLLLVLIIPFVGVVLYILFGRLRLSPKTRRFLNELYSVKAGELQRADLDMPIDDADFRKMTDYVQNLTGMPVCENTLSRFLESGEAFHAALLEELGRAKKFIFMEYFIISEGEMWNSVFEILARKVKEGVDVRIIYDDFGSLKGLRYNFKKRVLREGIKIINYNPFRPRLSMAINYRDHRKITVIDGNVGFIGGINIADEYINKKVLYGYWKDAAMLLKGDAVWNLTFLFLQMWQFCTRENIDYGEYKPSVAYSASGYVLPFGDGPLDNNQAIADIYLQMINRAKERLYITTPYLILDNETITALKIAAKSGVDVYILMPHIPDKKIIFAVSQSYFPELIEAGVKIYRYLPGFVHSKVVIADDRIALFGSANLDFRSLYLHYEASCLLYGTSSVTEMAEDFRKCLEESRLVTREEAVKKPWIARILVAVLKAFAPMF
ncbi:MAG: cardiolipin synthase [Bacillota bacterium]|jgi:cardiolipin synthase|nr:cardiolipin synthase [Bacillota bacterium]